MQGGQRVQEENCMSAVALTPLPTASGVDRKRSVGAPATVLGAQPPIYTVSGYNPLELFWGCEAPSSDLDHSSVTPWEAGAPWGLSGWQVSHLPGS